MTDPHTLTANLERAIQAERSVWTHIAEALHELHTDDRYQALGFETWNEFLAQPELAFAAKRASTLVRVWKVFGHCDRDTLAQARPSKLAITLPAISRGMAVDEALHHAISLPAGDLRTLCADPDAPLNADAEPIPCPECGRPLKERQT